MAAQQQAGSIRGVVIDKDFDVPLAAAQVTNLETGQEVTTSETGNYVFGEVPEGKYTLVFKKDGFLQQVRSNVVVTAGQLTDVDVALSNDFTEMEEFVVQDVLQLGAGTEAALLQLRFQSPALLDSISADLMSRAGASDAASALRLVAGASVENGKFAVIRGLPDRYVSSQLNGVRLPSADENTRAVELDQFPSPVIESIRVSKTFTPDQQGDASGGAVDVRLKGIPTVPFFFSFQGQTGFNSQVRGRSDFLTYDGGGVTFWGRNAGSRGIQSENLGESWTGAVGVKEGHAPLDSKWSMATGGTTEIADGIKLGVMGSFFYQRDSSFYEHGKQNAYWVETPGEGLVPQKFQLSSPDNFKTALFDITRAQQSVQWGGLASVGLETDNNDLSLTYLYTRTAEDDATLAIDTRGKQYFFPGYDPNDPGSPGYDQPDAAPYLRLETLSYTERSTDSLQLHGEHTVPTGDFAFFHDPKLDWTISHSTADLDQPDKRVFGGEWQPGRTVGPITIPPMWSPYKSSANFTLGNLQRIFKEIHEESEQYSSNLELPFEQWSEIDGYVKFGVFRDEVKRSFNQDTFSNFNDNSTFAGGFNEPWSGVFPGQNHPITASTYDVDYRGNQEITAGYGMIDLPLLSTLKVIGGARVEDTRTGVVNFAEPDATWFPPGASAPTQLSPGDADVHFHENDVLPAVALEYSPVDELTLRASYSETVARQTFKELTPIIQQEYLGGPIFIGNPDLRMSSLKNFDLRLDYRPFEDGLLSASWFKKDITDPIEYVQRITNSFDYTSAVNYPKGELSGVELEARQNLGRVWDPLEGLTVGANATFIDSKVTLSDEDRALFTQPGVKAPMKTRAMTNAPEHLYNAFAVYDLAYTGTQIGLFYTVQGDTLIAGAGVDNGRFVPSIYQAEYGTLNFSLSQKLGKYLRLQLQAKNLTDPKIETVYRSRFTGPDLTKTSYTKGIDYSISLTGEVTF